MVYVGETRTCSKCGRDLPATSEFFHRHGDKARPNVLWSSSCRECRTAAQRARYREDPEKARERWRGWYSANREYDKKRVSAWREAHPGRAAERSREYYIKNREAILAREQEWRENNRDRHRAMTDKWRATHQRQYRESVANQSRNRRAAAGHHTPADVRAQYKRQKGRCFWCRTELDRYHVDHVMPIAAGGTNDPENIVVSCPSCNLSKSSKHPMDFAGVMF